MSVQVEIPNSIFHLPADDLSRQVLETVALEGFKTGQLSAYQIRKMLGYETRFEVYEFLASHGVAWVNYSVEDLELERKAFKELLAG
ncbi:MAG: UPF0175 family protein [Acidobacteria bacterium]|nr:UPF0175 family protein [Acidobacteriota bacterium]